ncbi:ACT domain-containing protein [Svornostia abyssi]|uniref:ACT domain-containing protein n=2 Tax=Svornostia abyssi TaxID=2898438 RepID=A0ABY5PNV3_9ACTN|nr:ACT domain-containing protein [Parviterribacteraceae bacterium J379]
MIGKVGTALGEAGINVISAAVGHQRDEKPDDEHAVMIVTTDVPVPDDVLAGILASEGFVAGRSVALD